MSVQTENLKIPVKKICLPQIAVFSTNKTHPVVKKQNPTAIEKRASVSNQKAESRVSEILASWQIQKLQNVTQTSLKVTVPYSIERKGQNPPNTSLQSQTLSAIKFQKATPLTVSTVAIGVKHLQLDTNTNSSHTLIATQTAPQKSTPPTKGELEEFLKIGFTTFLSTLSSENLHYQEQWDSFIKGAIVACQHNHIELSDQSLQVLRNSKPMLPVVLLYKENKDDFSHIILDLLLGKIKAEEAQGALSVLITKIQCHLLSNHLPYQPIVQQLMPAFSGRPDFLSTLFDIEQFIELSSDIGSLTKSQTSFLEELKKRFFADLTTPKARSYHKCTLGSFLFLVQQEPQALHNILWQSFDIASKMLRDICLLNFKEKIRTLLIERKRHRQVCQHLLPASGPYKPYFSLAEENIIVSKICDLIVTKEGKVNTSIFSTLRQALLDRFPQNCPLRRRLRNGLEELRHDAFSIALINSPGIPLHPQGEKIIRTCHALSDGEPIKRHHITKALLSALFSSWYQGTIGSCHVTAALRATRPLSYEWILRDLHSLLSTGSITRTISGKGRNFPGRIAMNGILQGSSFTIPQTPPEKLDFEARLIDLPYLESALLYLGAPRENLSRFIHSVLEQISKTKNTFSLVELLDAATILLKQSPESKVNACNILESAAQNPFLRLYENSISGMHFSPFSIANPLMPEGEKHFLISLMKTFLKIAEQEHIVSPVFSAALIPTELKQMEQLLPSCAQFLKCAVDSTAQDDKTFKETIAPIITQSMVEKTMRYISLLRTLKVALPREWEVCDALRFLSAPHGTNDFNVLLCAQNQPQDFPLPITTQEEFGKTLRSLFSSILTRANIQLSPSTTAATFAETFLNFFNGYAPHFLAENGTPWNFRFSLRISPFTLWQTYLNVPSFLHTTFLNPYDVQETLTTLRQIAKNFSEKGCNLKSFSLIAKGSSHIFRILINHPRLISHPELSIENFLKQEQQQFHQIPNSQCQETVSLIEQAVFDELSEKFTTNFTFPAHLEETSFAEWVQKLMIKIEQLHPTESQMEKIEKEILRLIAKHHIPLKLPGFIPFADSNSFVVTSAGNTMSLQFAYVYVPWEQEWKIFDIAENGCFLATPSCFGEDQSKTFLSVFSDPIAQSELVELQKRKHIMLTYGKAKTAFIRYAEEFIDAWKSLPTFKEIPQGVELRLRETIAHIQNLKSLQEAKGRLEVLGKLLFPQDENGARIFMKLILSKKAWQLECEKIKKRPPYANVFHFWIQALFGGMPKENLQVPLSLLQIPEDGFWNQIKIRKQQQK
jgi:hypothetical protein